MKEIKCKRCLARYQEGWNHRCDPLMILLVDNHRNRIYPRFITEEESVKKEEV